MQVKLSWNSSAAATNYNIKRSNTNGGPYILAGSAAGTNYTDLNLTNGVVYYYVASAVNQIGESANSPQVGVQPVSTNAVSLMLGLTNNNLTLSWPVDHTGWQLQMQTNALGMGLGTNWADITDSMWTNRISLPVDTSSGSVFYRLIYQ